jgi:hypothetical protein
MKKIIDNIEQGIKDGKEKAAQEECKAIHAHDCKCCKCGKQAVCFWPVIDPDIQSNPYCRECKDDQVLMLMIAMNEEG